MPAAGCPQDLWVEIGGDQVIQLESVNVSLEGNTILCRSFKGDGVISPYGQLSKHVLPESSVLYRFQLSQSNNSLHLCLGRAQCQEGWGN